VQNAKATNTEIDHLALMNCYPGSISMRPAARPEAVYYTIEADRTTLAKGDTVTVSLTADGTAFGGLQAKLCYDSTQLQLVNGTAAFTSAFAQNAAIKMAAFISHIKVNYVKIMFRFRRWWR
jgi:hypothetical protein